MVQTFVRQLKQNNEEVKLVEKDEDVIILRVALNDKVAEARVCKNGLKAITITPNEVFAKADVRILFF